MKRKFRSTPSKNTFLAISYLVLSLFIAAPGPSENTEAKSATTSISNQLTTVLKEVGKDTHGSIGQTECQPSSEGSPNDEDDCFKLIKQNVAKSEYRISDWKKLDQDKQLEKSMCHNTAEYARNLLTGSDRYHLQGYKGRVVSKAEEFKKGNHAISMNLLTPSNNNEHLIFNINVPQGDHTFVIEKKGKEKTTCWRVYQSYACSFTLAEWLGIDPWRSDSDFLTQQHKKYGNGRCLTQKELKEFLDLQLSHPNLDVNADMYDANPTLCSSLK